MKEQILNEVKVKFENGRLIVPTPKGDIVVTVKDDECCKGVYVDIESEDVKDKYACYEESKAPMLPLAAVCYDECCKKLSTYIYGSPLSDEPTHEINHTRGLIFNEDFDVLQPGTKVIHNGKLGYIIKDNRDDEDECLDGYEESLNYAIKYASKEESYEDILIKINSSKDENPYDTMQFWRNVYEVKSLKMNILINELYNKENMNSILDKLLERYHKEQLKEFDSDKLNEELINILCYSFSSILAKFIEDNKFFFNRYSYDNHLTFYNYIDKVLDSCAKVSPFTTKQPIEFFEVLTKFGENLLSRI